MWGLTCFVLCMCAGHLFTACSVSGQNRNEKKVGGPGADYVCIGSVRAARLEEQREVIGVLEMNGIRADFWGTRLYSILVPKGQELKAAAILRTNQLVLDHRVTLGTPTDIHCGRAHLQNARSIDQSVLGGCSLLKLPNPQGVEPTAHPVHSGSFCLLNPWNQFLLGNAGRYCPNALLTGP